MARWRGAVVIALLGCGGSLPRPPAAPVATADYVAVPFAPRPPPVEYLPASPDKRAVWADGTWEWLGDRYVWRFGSWVVPPEGTRRARWVLVRRPEDGQLFFAPSSWKDASGQKVDDKSWAYALGPRARARPGGGGGGAPLPLDSDAIVTPPPEEDGEGEE